MNELNLDGWQRHDWEFHNQIVTVLQREPFRWSWFATKLVTCVFVIHDTPDSYASILDDYNPLHAFSRDHKKTRIPFSLQAGFAILPIYVGKGFSEELISQIKTKHKKRWCVMHIPSLFDTETNTCHTLCTNSFWGCVYRDFISDVIHRVALGCNRRAKWHNKRMNRIRQADCTLLVHVNSGLG